MAAVWEELRDLLYRPDENISPLDPATESGSVSLQLASAFW